MPAVQPPVAIQSGGETALLFRLLIGDLLGSGVVGAAALAVTAQPTPAMSVQVAAGRVVVAGTLATLHGSYYCVNDGPVTVAVSPAHATNPRKDLVVARVSDSFYSGTANLWSIAVVTGTPAATPAEPAAGANSGVLALIDVPAAATAVTNSLITDRRPRAVPVTAGVAAEGADATETGWTTNATWTYREPIVSVRVPPSGQLLVHYAAELRNDTAGWASMSTAVLSGPGAIIVDASTGHMATVRDANYQSGARSRLFTGLTPGAAVLVYAAYRRDGGSNGFARRRSVQVIAA